MNAVRAVFALTSTVVLAACGGFDLQSSFLAAGEGTDLTVATYNVHRWKGADDERSVARIANVVSTLDADIVAFQEIDNSFTGRGDERRQELFADLMGQRFVEFDGEKGPGITARGNAILISDEVEVISSERTDISEPGRDRREFVDVYLDVDGRTVRVIGAHLGLNPGERKRQIRVIAKKLHTRPAADATVFMGDLNEWNPLARTFRPFKNRLEDAPTGATFPAGGPFFRLDRVWTSQEIYVSGVEVLDTALAAEASDHLPVRAFVRF